MPFVPRKDEAVAVAEAIEHEESLEAVSKTALKTAFAQVQRRKLWVVVVRDSQTIYGPYASERDAYNALASGKIDGFEDEEGIKALLKEKKIPTLGGLATVLPMTGPLLQAEREAESDREDRLLTEHLCKDCEHKLLAHGLDGRTTKCSVSGCQCKAPKPLHR